jgi:tetratricopeptide (TPR) repeat protein
MQRLDKAVSIEEQLVREHPNIPDFALSLAHTHHRRADVLQRAGQLDEAERSLRRAVSVQTGIADQFPESAPHQAAAALFRFSLARVLADRDRLPEACEMLESATADLETAAADESAPPYVRGLAARSYQALAHILRQLGEHDQADQAQDRARQLHPRPRLAPHSGR